MRRFLAACLICSAGLGVSACVENSGLPQTGSTMSAGSLTAPQPPGLAPLAAASQATAANPASPQTPVAVAPAIQAGAISAQPVSLRPGSPAYRCEGGGALTIDNRGSEVTIMDPSGEVHRLPAAPPNQTSRYGEKPYALILDGGDALFVKPRHSPYTCKR